ncbi:sensor histidine kinase [Tahibacter amnicola]|uniref:histidine kinase n=1 Tax=Tahibacter amnicola TaxID=2976241 RepID=A0ABY6BM39_9GAMM|nr:ATP-binding protein [Tahibacter amnicola]UXI68877.1 ATP-binding protein [Tahibacter amnicola]
MPVPDGSALTSNRPSLPRGGYGMALVGTATAVVIAAILEQLAGPVELSLVFMLAVIVIASRTAAGPAAATALLCFLAYNFFFIEPRLTFYISARHGLTTVALFLAAALLAGRLAARLATQVQALRVSHCHALARHDLAQRLTSAADERTVIDAAHATFRDVLGAETWIRLGPTGLATHGSVAADASVAAIRPWDDAVEQHGWWFMTLAAGADILGVIGLKLPPPLDHLDEAERRLARTMASDIAQAILRTRLAAELQGERIATENERLRSALLSSVSHDLRTPLAAIIGAAGSLENYGESMSETDRRSLLEAIRGEGERLDRYIQNLLDMTRLGHGDLVLNRDWIGVDELIGSAIRRLQHQVQTPFRPRIDPALAPVWVHPALIEQALFNVLENAAKFSPPGEAVLVSASLTAESEITIDISDSGPGIPEAERERIFERFYSVERGDRGRDGTGLGLAICRGMVGAHGGSVQAQPGPDGRGTTIRIRLPSRGPGGASP